MIQQQRPGRSAPRAGTRQQGRHPTRKPAWARKIDFTLEDPEAAFLRAQKRYDQLSSQLTWPRAIKKLLGHLPKPAGNAKGKKP
jgi:hypothetical protein